MIAERISDERLRDVCAKPGVPNDWLDDGEIDRIAYELLVLRTSHAALIKVLEDIYEHGVYEESSLSKAARLYGRIVSALENAREVTG